MRPHPAFRPAALVSSSGRSEDGHQMPKAISLRLEKAAILGAILLCAGVLGLASSAAAGTDAASSSRQPVVTSAVQVTTNPNPSRAHSSPQMAVNPTTGELVVVESEVRHDYACRVHLSTDDGRSWFVGGDPMLEPWTECSRKAINGPYATLTFDPDGVLYIAFFASNPQYATAENLPIHIFLARSEDGGRTFETSFVFKAPEPVEKDEGLHNNDRPMVAVDQQDPSNVYVAWMGRGAGDADKSTKALIAASHDGGRTFGEPVDITDERGGYQPRLAVTADGTVHAIYPIGLSGIPEEADPFEVVRTVYHRRSTDGGESWSEPVEVDQGNAGFYAGRKYLLAADHTSGNLYAVWYGNAKPKIDPQTDDVDIFLRASADGGRTWSDRRVVNDDAEDGYTNHYDPGISIAPNGRIDIAWYDFRNSPYPERFPDDFAAPFNHGGFQDVYYAWSTDGGRTFSPNVRVTDRIINREIGVWSNNIHSHMSVGIASTDDAAYFAWQDTRNGTYEQQAEDVYMASAQHAGSAPKDGGESAMSLLGIGGSGLALGMGIAMVVAWWISRRTAGVAPRETGADE